MKKFKCPGCGEETISIIKKANLNIQYKYKCNKCGIKYGPPYAYSTILTVAICNIEDGSMYM